MIFLSVLPRKRSLNALHWNSSNISGGAGVPEVLGDGYFPNAKNVLVAIPTNSLLRFITCREVEE